MHVQRTPCLKPNHLTQAVGLGLLASILFGCGSCDDLSQENASQGGVDAGQDLGGVVNLDFGEGQDLGADNVDLGSLVMDQGTGGDVGGADMQGEQKDLGSTQEEMGQSQDLGLVGDLGGLDAGVGEDLGQAMQDMSGVEDMFMPVDMFMSPDLGLPDMGGFPGGCVATGTQGTHVARFKWLGNGPSSRAYVRYETNNLPDTSRWKAGAFGRSPSYRPVYNDTFLGAGGLQLSSTNFIDVELSTMSLPRVTKATISILGRSYNTTSPGSFNWQTFDGTGASPRGLVSNSAPYKWYSADATQALPAGNGGILLRIKADGPSNSLIVNSVEICFDVR